MFQGFSILFASVAMLSFGRIAVGQSSVGQSGDASACTNPRVLGSAGKRSILNDPGTCDGRLCDNYIAQGVWYTLDGETTGNRMPESCVPVWRCGTYIPIWMNGAHPTADSPGPVTVSVCAQQTFNGSCCAWRDQIRVKFCNSVALGDYYVYQLKIPPYCDMAYCGGSGVVCPAGSAWNDIKASCTTPATPPVTEDPVLGSPYISDTRTVTDINGNDFTARKFSVKCTFRYQKLIAGDDGARFDVIFEAGGQAIAKFTMASTSTVEHVAVMDESYLAGHLDTFLRCKVSSYWQSPYPARATRSSNQIYYGLQTLNSNGIVISSISVSEAQRVTIQVQTTFPVTTPWCFNIPAGTRCNPSYQFRIFSDKLLLSSCTFELSYDKPKSSAITLSPIPTSGTVIQPYSWPLNYQAESTSQTDGSIFIGYKSSPISVTIIDAVPQKYCSFTGDPHVYTFGRSWYDLFLAGDFYLARVSGRQLEIQVRTVPCTIWHEISCTCGVMAREGNNIVGINNCDSQSPILIRYLKDTSNPGGIIVNNYGSTWTIKLLSGVEIYVSTWGGRYFHVYVYGLGNENYDGLCSYSGSQYECNSDCDSENRYRVPVADSMFRFSSTNLPKCTSSRTLLPSCDCRNGGSRNVPCYSPDQSNLFLTSNICDTSAKRRKREAVQPSGETFFDIDLFASNITIDRDFGKKPLNLVWPTASGITEKAATDQCDTAVGRSPAYTYCTTEVAANVSQIIRTCVSDIQISDELRFGEDSMASQVEELCQFRAKVEAVQTQNSSDAEAQTREEMLKTMLCDRQCSQKGDCINGVCRCNPGFAGSGCSLRAGQAPTILGSFTRNCDIRSQGGNLCLKVVLEVNASDTRMTCKVRDSTGYSYFDTSPTVTSGQVTCNLQPSPVNTTDPSVNATTNHTIFVSVSNDGNAYSNEWQFIIFDSLCVTCTDRSCTPQTSSSCAISGRCYSADQTYSCTKDLIGYCKPKLCSTRWMTKNSGSCSDGFDVCPSSSSKLPTVGILWLIIIAVVMTTVCRK